MREEAKGKLSVSFVHACVRLWGESRDTDILARDEWEEGWMRLVMVWRGLSRCKLEKFPYGSKMSATLLIEFLMFARCCRGTLKSTKWTISLSLCTVCVYMHLF